MIFIFYAIKKAAFMAAAFWLILLLKN